ncbi:MAG: dihydroorotase [Firmicutes bacterium]|jgi:dihydroorotase|nr:dihydroorotase [Bacillota bacterium]
MRLRVRDGRIIDPAHNVDSVADVLIEDGRIVGLEPATDPDRGSTQGDAQVIDATGKIVCPGFIDMHVHFRDPGYEYKEDIETGSRAAAAGGFTTVCCMPNTDPVIDNGAVASYVRKRAQDAGVIDVLPFGSITKRQAGEELSEMGELVRAGCVGFSDDGKPVMRADVMRNALSYSRIFNAPIISHCEDLNLTRDGQMHEGYYSFVFGLKGIPAEAEETMVARDLLLARLTGGRLHVCHVSTRGSLELIRRAKAEGIAVTCEVTPHHLTLTDEVVGSYDTNTKVNPPLRSEDHVQALRQALSEGLIDCIATDHAPHHLESKDCEYAAAAPGIAGLETAVAVIMDRLVHSGALDITKMVSLFTVGPARVLGLDRGTLSPGARADITIIDPDRVKRVNPETFNSKARNTPFAGMELRGWPWMTISEGRVVAHDGSVG